jgi:aconitase A
VSLAVAVLFAGSAAIAFAKQPAQQEENLFKIVQKSIKPGTVREKNKVKNPLPKVTIFKDMAKGIKEGAAKSKAQNLRAAKTK